MAGKLVNRCLIRDEENRQCLKMAGHPPNCQFVDGQAALEAALANPTLRVELGGTAHTLGVVVLAHTDAADLTSEEMLAMRRAEVAIGCDGTNVVVLKSRQPISSTGIEAVVDAMRAVDGFVSFGVGLIRIETRTDYLARTQS